MTPLKSDFDVKLNGDNIIESVPLVEEKAL